MKTIIEMAREAGLIGLHEPSEKWIKEFSHLVALVRADEREACANACEDEICNCCWDEQAGAVAEHLAETIRARGNT